jgi:transposase
MTRGYARAVKGECAIDNVPVRKGKLRTIISSVRMNGDIIHMEIDGSMNGDIFKKYLEKYLTVRLKKGDIVVMNNLRAHKVEGVRSLIYDVEASLLYLPAYSPDLNPIEEMWSKLKARLKKLKARTPEELVVALEEAFSIISLEDIAGWFGDSGYSKNSAILS